MEQFREISPEELTTNAFTDIGKRWLMIGCRDEKNARTNLMTASWGSVGILWGKPVCTIFVRQSRYTHELIEQNERIGVSVFDPRYQKELAFCGRESGRNVDKVAECGFTPFEFSGAVGYRECDLFFCLKKLYEDRIRPECFVDRSMIDKWYSDNDYHSVYVCEIEKVLVKA